MKRPAADSPRSRVHHQNLSLVQGSPSPPSESYRTPTLSAYVDSLWAVLERLAVNTDLYFDRAGLNDSHSFTFRTQRVEDPSVDCAFETTMSSLVPCSKEQGTSLIVQFFDLNEKHDSRKVRLPPTMLLAHLLSHACVVLGRNSW